MKRHLQSEYTLKPQIGDYLQILLFTLAIILIYGAGAFVLKNEVLMDKEGIQQWFAVLLFIVIIAILIASIIVFTVICLGWGNNIHSSAQGITIAYHSIKQPWKLTRKDLSWSEIEDISFEHSRNTSVGYRRIFYLITYLNFVEKGIDRLTRVNLLYFTWKLDNDCSDFEEYIMSMMSLSKKTS